MTGNMVGFGDDLDDDLDAIDNPDPTTRNALINARRGQGGFRADLLSYWDGRCAITGCSINEMLRASHIKSWKNSTDKERLDPQNGLLLGAHLDALFDRGLISFDDRGNMLVSEQLNEANDVWGLRQPMRIQPSVAMRRYLQHHRQRNGFI